MYKVQPKAKMSLSSEACEGSVGRVRSVGRSGSVGRSVVRSVGRVRSGSVGFGRVRSGSVGFGRVRSVGGGGLSSRKKKLNKGIPCDWSAVIALMGEKESDLVHTPAQRQ